MGGRIPWKKEEHPVEVIGRMRHPQQNGGIGIQVTEKGVRLRADSGYCRDFSLDGISWSGEALHLFYFKYIEGRVEGVKSGGKCTIIMYGATGSGKSYTMFGTAKEPGIAYRALHHIMEGDEDDILKVRVIEIYNEEVYDLLGANSAKTSSPGRVRLEVRGRKVKNACSISGKKVDDIVREIQVVEKRRAVKSTNCNERSSRSHCMIIVDVPSVGGRLVLVDMAGSENIEQAGIGVEAKMQTGKINQGNGALKRVVEAIANGDCYIPYRDSKLTMLLQDSFEDDESRILMILCASTDPKDIQKTISTLEYGAKAKGIVKLPKSPLKEKINATDQVVLETRIKVMNALIAKLQEDNRLKDECRDEIAKELNGKTQQLENLKNSVGEKRQFMQEMLKIDENFLNLINKIENSRKKISETETRRYKEMQEQQMKISELVDKVQGIEAELIFKMREHQGGLSEVSTESSLAHYLYHPMDKSCAVPLCHPVDANGADILFSYINGASNGLQVQVNSDVLEDPNSVFTEESRVPDCNALREKSSLQSPCKDDSGSDNISGEDQQTSKKITRNDDGNKMHNLRDWDEEVQFTVVHNDSEHQAVICRSCDQIDELSLSDIDSEVPGPEVQVCSSADLAILNGNSPIANHNNKMEHPAPPSRVFESHGDNIETDICGETNTLSDGNPHKSSICKTMSFSSTCVQNLRTNKALDVDWTGGMSLKGWLPVIPETSFEGEEDSETCIEGSKVVDEEGHEKMGNVEKDVLVMENMSENMSLKGWLPVIPETSFEGEEDCETCIEGSKVVDEEGHEKMGNVEKDVLVMENMSENFRSETNDSKFIVDNFDTDPGNTAFHLPKQGDSCTFILYSETDNASNSDFSYIRDQKEEHKDHQFQYLQLEDGNDYRQNQTKEAKQDSERLKCGNKAHTETQTPCLESGNHLLLSVDKTQTCLYKGKEGLKATAQNLGGFSEERKYTGAIQSVQITKLFHDDPLCVFELDPNYDSSTNYATGIEQHPRHNYEETKVVESANLSSSRPVICSEETDVSCILFSDDFGSCSSNNLLDGCTGRETDVVEKSCNDDQEGCETENKEIGSLTGTELQDSVLNTSLEEERNPPFNCFNMGSNAMVHSDGGCPHQICNIATHCVGKNVCEGERELPTQQDDVCPSPISELTFLTPPQQPQPTPPPNEAEYIRMPSLQPCGLLIAEENSPETPSSVEFERLILGKPKTIPTEEDVESISSQVECVSPKSSQPEILPPPNSKSVEVGENEEDLQCGHSNSTVQINLKSPLEPIKLHRSSIHDICNVDVYVKWGNSTEALGKLICIVQISKAANLAELRKVITPRIPHVNKQFTFLMLGETGGGEVDQEIESEARVGSLPDCLVRKGCRLACLRPPRRIKLSLPPDRLSVPLSQIENQIPHGAQTMDKKKGSKSSNARSSSSVNRGGSSNIPNRNRGKTTFKDKARALYCQDIACKFLHGV